MENEAILRVNKKEWEEISYQLKALKDKKDFFVKIKEGEFQRGENKIHEIFTCYKDAMVDIVYFEVTENISKNAIREYRIKNILKTLKGLNSTLETRTNK